MQEGPPQDHVATDGGERNQGDGGRPVEASRLWQGTAIYGESTVAALHAP